MPFSSKTHPGCYPMNAPGNPKCRVGTGWDGATAKREMKWVGRMGLCWFNQYGVNSKKYRKPGWTWKTRIVKNKWGYDETEHYQGHDKELARKERDIIRRQQQGTAVYQPKQDSWLCGVCGWYHRPGTACPHSAWERHPAGRPHRGFIAPGGSVLR